MRRVVLSGAGDLGGLPAIEQTIRSAVSGEQTTEVVVDIDGLSAVHDAVIGMLLGASADLSGRGTTLTVMCSRTTTIDRLQRLGAGHLLRQSSPIWHLAIPDDWTAAVNAASDYRISTRGASLDDVGFIHCSHAHQIEGVAERFYSDCSMLLLLRVDPLRLAGSPVIEEPPAPGVSECFPHVYGPIPIAAVTRVGMWERSPAGWRFGDQAGPENTPEWSGERFE